MEKTDYLVTEKAGTHVAGKRVRAGETIALTEGQARYELLLESIQLPPVTPLVTPIEPASKPVRNTGK